MKCNNCGSELKHNSKFCSNCGYEVATQKGAKHKTTRPSRGIKGGMTLVEQISLLFALVVIVGILCPVLVRHSNNNVTPANNDIEATEVINYNSLYLDIKLSNGDEKHILGVSIDGEPVDTYEGKYYTKLLEEVTPGEHVITFVVDNKEKAVSEINVIIDKDITICGCLVEDESNVYIGELKSIDNIHDSAITYESVMGESVLAAEEILITKNYVNFAFITDDGSEIENPEDWEIVAENVKDGDVLDKNALIELTCKKTYFMVCMNMKFSSNWFFNKYGVDIYIDDELINRAEHGTDFEEIKKLRTGDHVIEFRKVDDAEIKYSKSINVDQDETLSGTIVTYEDHVEVQNEVVSEGVDGMDIEVIDVRNMSTQKAMSMLKEIGLTNIICDPQEANGVSFIVIDQDIEAGDKLYKKDPIKLICEPSSDYLAKTYLKLKINESIEKAEELNQKISFFDYLKETTINGGADELENSDEWVVKKAKINTDETIALYLAFTGEVEMPNVMGKTLAFAKADMQKKLFSGVVGENESGEEIRDETEWVVEGQSVKAGNKVNANSKVTLKVKKIKNTAQPLDKIVKENGQKKINESGKEREIYAFKNRGKNYQIYYIVDMEEGYVYSFIDDDDNSITCDRVKIDSGTLDDVIIVTYHDGGSTWQNGLHYKYKGMKEHMILEDDDHFEYDFYATDLNHALTIRSRKQIVNY